MPASHWEDLLQEAFRIIDHVNTRNAGILSEWTFGGGTAMMLQIGHRESHDIDLFLNDAQLLAYVRASVSEMQFGLGPPAYGGDGSSYLKVAFEGLGEIDFIAASPITEDHTCRRVIQGRPVLLETIPEIIAKKIAYRGPLIQPRDIFDIAAACRSGFQSETEEALRNIRDCIPPVLKKLGTISPAYVENDIRQLAVRPEFQPLATDAMQITQSILKTLQQQ